MNTKTSEKLEEAQRLLQRCAALIEQARKENSSLDDYYDLEEIERNLKMLASNPQGYVNFPTDLEEILGELGDSWSDGEGPDPEVE